MKNKLSTIPNRRRTALLLLPLLVIPFLTLGFWALGGGTQTISKRSTTSGLNMELPGASLKTDASENKLGFYEQAEQDSAKRSAELKTDPLYRMEFTPDTTTVLENRTDQSYDPTPNRITSSGDPNEERVYRKLAELNQQLQASSSSSKLAAERAELSVTKKNEIATDPSSLDRLQGVGSQNDEASASDPELAQLSGLMDKIIAVQHPQAMAKSAREHATVPGHEIYPVTKTTLHAHVSFLDTTEELANPETGFFSLQQIKAAEDANAIDAIVDQKQMVSDGGIIKLRLLDDMSFNGAVIPRQTLVYGKVALSGERLLITITAVRYQNSLFAVKLEVFDLDGQPGLYIPGTQATNPVAPVSDNAVQMLNLATLDPSLKAQAATAGMAALKSMLSKKAKRVRVTVDAGYKVLLK